MTALDISPRLDMGPGAFAGPGWRVAFAHRESFDELTRAAGALAADTHDQAVLDRFCIPDGGLACDAGPADLVVLDTDPTADSIRRLVAAGRFVVAIWPEAGVERAVAVATALAADLQEQAA